MALDKKEKEKAVRIIASIISKLNNPKTKRGGLSRLGEACGLSNSAVAQMVTLNRIPVTHVKTFVQLAKDNDVKFKGRPVIKWDFRPDVFDAD